MRVIVRGSGNKHRLRFLPDRIRLFILFRPQAKVNRNKFLLRALGVRFACLSVPCVSRLGLKAVLRREHRGVGPGLEGAGLPGLSGRFFETEETVARVDEDLAAVGVDRRRTAGHVRSVAEHARLSLGRNVSSASVGAAVLETVLLCFAELARDAENPDDQTFR